MYYCKDTAHIGANSKAPIVKIMSVPRTHRNLPPFCNFLHQNIQLLCACANANGLFPIQNAQMSFAGQVLLDPLQQLKHCLSPPAMAGEGVGTEEDRGRWGGE